MVILDANITPDQVHDLLHHADLGQIFTTGDLPTLPIIQWAMRSPDMAATIIRQESGAPCGIFVMRWLSPYCVKLGGGFLKEARGATVKESLTRLFDTLFEKTSTVKIVGETLATNKPCLMYAAAMGFQKEGINRASARVGRDIVDQVYLGLTIGDWHGWHLRERAKRSTGGARSN